MKRIISKKAFQNIIEYRNLHLIMPIPGIIKAPKAITLINPENSNLFLFYWGGTEPYESDSNAKYFAVNRISAPDYPSSIWAYSASWSLARYDIGLAILDFVSNPDFIPTEWDIKLIKALLYKHDKTLRKKMLENGYGRGLDSSKDIFVSQ